MLHCKENDPQKSLRDHILSRTMFSQQAQVADSDWVEGREVTNEKKRWQGHVREVPTSRGVAGIEWVGPMVTGVVHIRHVDERVDRTFEHATRDPPQHGR
ncbi:unnamed protein product [Sphenostylis stenocarpa]|uniref:Uncharacterized protein n=1 Tax=Sphenostylis stenocarpa TaxID=92480 RepID=A0AA86W1K3_9FABA|nr:unnamed protein product [Sphenostylis stenocarpa]